ncbi:hypothetical protein EV127DRAFT_336159 [Xylaria flabelliformis]|nr:hypothetical protein EV127DRAFT_336159 [Xylaria flabelliformis]
MASSRSPSNSDSISPPLPMKGIPNLHMLDKPVNWTWLIPGELSTRMENSKLAKLYQSIEGALGKGFLPMELYATLNSKLNLNGESDSLFARRPVRPITPDDLIMTNDERSSFDASLPVQEDEKSKLLGRIHVQSLISEFKALRKIEHWALDRMLELEEASWTGRVHAPMLDLATLHTPSVDAEIVPDAVIMKEYLPKATFQGVARTASLPADRKIIDFAMVLRPDRDDRRIDFFLDTLDHPTFNQSNYYTLEYMPTGVFIVADPHGGKYNETKVQLGIWLASWFDRVSRFPCYDPDDPLPPPDIPLIIIRKQIWELWFGFNQDSEYEICGPIIIGSTDQLLKLYQLLAVLRVLVQWMATDFRKWVDGCLKEAGI